MKMCQCNVTPGFSIKELIKRGHLTPTGRFLSCYSPEPHALPLRDQFPEYVRTELQRMNLRRISAEQERDTERRARQFYTAIAVLGWTGFVLVLLGV